MEFNIHLQRGRCFTIGLIHNTKRESHESSSMTYFKKRTTDLPLDQSTRLSAFSQSPLTTPNKGKAYTHTRSITPTSKAQNNALRGKRSLSKSPSFYKSHIFLPSQADCIKTNYSTNNPSSKSILYIHPF